jgi:hypothetical protein
MATTPYNPQIQVPANKPFSIDQAAPDGGRSMYYDPTLNLWRAFQSTAEVLEYLPLAKNRKGNFPIYINRTGTLNGDGTFTGGDVEEWWFKNGVLNANLVKKTQGGAAFDIRRYPYMLTAPASSFQNNEWIGGSFLGGGRDNGDIFLVPEANGETDDSIFTFNSVTGTLTPVNLIAVPGTSRLFFIFKINVPA